MPNIATHLIIPLFCLFIFYKDKKDMHKYLLLLLPFTLLPDLDFVFGLEGHRQVFHNILFLIGVYLIFSILRNKFLFPIMFYVSSHILLDLFDGYGIGLFYPFITENVYIYIGLSLKMSLREIIFTFNYGFTPSNITFLNGETISIIDSIGILSIFLLIISYILSRKLK